MLNSMSAEARALSPTPRNRAIGPKCRNLTLPLSRDLPPNLRCGLVRSKPNENRLSQETVVGPSQIGNFSDKLRFDPVHLGKNKGRPEAGLARGRDAQRHVRSALSPLATIRSASSDKGRCSASASGVSPESHRSPSAGDVRMTGMAFGWIGATIALASVVRKPKSSYSPSTGALGASHAAPGRP